MGHTRQQWEQQIRAHLGDHGVIQQIPHTRLPTAMAQGFAIVSGDRPYEVSQTFAGDGSTYDFTLTSWEDRWSRIIRVEYPTGNREPSIIEGRRYEVLRGTATFRMLADTPATGESVKVTYAARWPLPDDTAGTDKIPTPWFEAAAGLIASVLIKSVAVEWARQSSSHVAGTFTERDPGPLFSAAKELRGLYNEVVLGIPEGTSDDGEERRSEIAYRVADQDVFPRALFRRRT
jgi:hypothetical protein